MNVVYFTKSVGVPMTMLSNIIVYVHKKRFQRFSSLYRVALCLYRCYMTLFSAATLVMTRYPIPVRINDVDLLLCFIEDLFKTFQATRINYLFVFRHFTTLVLLSYCFCIEKLRQTTISPGPTLPLCIIIPAAMENYLNKLL